MISGEALIGKVAIYVAEKIIAKKISLSFDEKKRACRAFVEFYFCLDRLEELNGLFLGMLNSGVENDGICDVEVELLMRSINSVSQRFIDIGGELHSAIDLVSPEIANAVGGILASKGGFLLVLSRSMCVNKSGSGIEYLEPEKKILEIDMNLYDEWLSENSGDYQDNQSYLEWPQSVLLFGEYEEVFHSKELAFNDVESIKRLSKVLEKHGTVLSEAREKIRELISNKFSIEDILYVSKGMTRDKF